MLGVVAHDKGSLVSEVQQEPQLDAGVRDGEPDVVLLGETQGLIELGVLIAIKDAPNLVMGAPSFSSDLLGLCLLRLYRVLNQPERATLVRQSW